jgi:amphi-Trp domain-containing protein
VSTTAPIRVQLARASPASDDARSAERREGLTQTRMGAHVDLVELKEKTTVSREAAATQLHAIADELASGNGIVMERDRLRFVARVPDEVHLKVEFEIEDDGSEFEIELSW